MRNAGILIIDMQPNYMRSIPDRKLEELINHQGMLLQLCAASDIPVVTMEMIGARETDPRILAAAQAVPRHEHLRKSSRSAFTNPDLHSTLCSHKIRDIILSGLNTSECVYETALSALHLKYRVWTTDTLMAEPTEILCASTQGTPIGRTDGWYDTWYHDHTNHHPNVTSLLRALD